jgi:taspase (threonine aspartase 1)
LVTAEAKSAWQQYTNILAQAQAAEMQPGAAGAVAPAAPTAVTAGATQQQQDRQQPDAADVSTPTAKRQRLEPSPTVAEAAAAAAAHAAQQAEQPLAPAAAATDVTGQQSAPPARLADVCDTVGAVVVDACGCVAAGVSSGGLALKTEGRVGEAAVIGAGCWAADGTWASDVPTEPGQQQSAAATPVGGILHPLPGDKTVAALHAVCCVSLQHSMSLQHWITRELLSPLW